MKRRTTWRLTGKIEPFTRAPKHVTTRRNLRDETIDAHSPLDALVTYCDAHGWRVERFDPTEGQPVPMDATIRASDSKSERVNVIVTAVSVDARTNRDGTSWAGIYRVAVIS